MAVVKLSIEVITLPVSDVERTLRFYVDQVGFTIDVDYAPNNAFRVVQLTPPGSSCSIQIGRGLTDAPVGSVQNIYLIVADLEAARNRLLERGVEVSQIRHKASIDAWDGGFAPGLDPAQGLRQLCLLFRSGWQRLGVARARLPSTPLTRERKKIPCARSIGNVRYWPKADMG
jgi:catechol 2,3-dioxygenase-like lactoylglutathione lyase family enzyme